MTQTLTLNEIYAVIDKVAKNHKNKSFDCYTVEDIEQHVWRIALEQLPNFTMNRGTVTDPHKALERWLNTVVSNRLANFYRDNYQVKKKLHANTITDPKVTQAALDGLAFNSDEILDNELLLQIINSLDLYYIDILEALLSGESINSYYKNKLMNKLKEVMSEYV